MMKTARLLYAIAKQKWQQERLVSGEKVVVEKGVRGGTSGVP